MRKKNGTGPYGTGPKTKRGFGPCNKIKRASTETAGQGRRGGNRKGRGKKN